MTAKERKQRSSKNVSKRNKKDEKQYESESSSEEESSTDETSSGTSSSSSASDESPQVKSVPIKKRKHHVQTKISSNNMSSSENDSSSNDESDDSEDDESASDEKGSFFTDDNANWLKPKTDKQTKLLSSDEEEEEEDDDLLEVERQARIVDEEMELEQEQAQEEYQRTIAQSTAKFHLPTSQELEEEDNRVVPPSELRERIEGILEALADFKARRQAHRSRSEYIHQLISDMAELHGYLPELMEYIVTMLGPSEAWEFVTASDVNRPLVVRTNTLKVRRKDLAASLMKRGVTLDPLASWSKVGLLIRASNIPIGATPEYLSGQYMLQSAASMCPVLALDPQRHEHVLDMSAAPGGKTSYVAQLMANTGYILANDIKADRQKATVANLHRLGVKNVVTCLMDGRNLGEKFPNKFDRVLLDAPCSGLGVISRDASVKIQRTLADIQRTAHLQKELLLSAIDALNAKSSNGGYMVYSTCSVSVAENEEVVQYALGKRDIKLVSTALEFGKPGLTRYQNKRFHPSVALTRRFYPHVHNMDGFFVAKIKKLSNSRHSSQQQQQAQSAVKEKASEVAQNENDSEKASVVTNKKDGDFVLKKKKGKKRRRGGTTHHEGETQQKKPRNNLSVPPSVQEEKKKKKQNAKTTKPRRQKNKQEVS